MKIMFLIRSLAYGGAERQLVVLAQGLQRRGHEVSVAVFYPNGPLQKDLELEGIPVHVLEKRHRWDIFGFLRRLYTLVKTHDPDILHGYMVVSNLLTVLFKFIGFRQKMVWGVRSANMDLSRYHWSMRTTFKLSCLASRYADLIIVNSFRGEAFHRSQMYPKHKMVVVANGIDTDRFNANASIGERVRREWGINVDKQLIGIVGRLDPMKNYETFLAAAKQLAEVREDVCFVCIGDGPTEYKAELRNMGAVLEAKGELVWAGARHDIEAVYNAFDILTSCSSYGEGFPNVIGEAMACGTPCVVTDVGDSAIIVGSTGVVVKPGDTEGLVAAWSGLMTNINSELKHIIRRRIVEHYSIEALVENTEPLLLGQLGRGGQPV